MNPVSDFVLGRAVEESLESLSFLQVTELHLYWGRVGILEPCLGSVTVAFPERLARRIVCDMYSKEAETLSEEIMLDAIAEIANTVAGRLASRVVDPECPFTLGLPSRGIGRPEVESDNAMIRLFDLGGDLFMVSVEGQDLLAACANANGKPEKRTAPPPGPVSDGWG